MSHPAFNPMIEFLRDEGFRPEVERDDVMQFRLEGGTYVVTFDREDLPYVRLIYPNFWRIGEELEREHAVSAADAANRRIKVAKVFTSNDNVSASIELFLPDAGQFPKIFERALSALRAIVAEFIGHARKPDRVPVAVPAMRSETLH